MNEDKVVYGYFDGACSDPIKDGDLGLGFHANFDLEKVGSLIRVSKSGGHGTNNEAEFKALIELMTALISKGVGQSTVIIRGDSKIVLDMVNGNKEARNPRMRQFMQKVKDLESQFKQIIYMHVTRDKNSLADSLSKKGMKRTIIDYYNYKM